MEQSIHVESTNRVAWIDFAKTIGLFLMILGHGSLLDRDTTAFIYSFHMPLFFILAGLLWKPRPIVTALKKNWSSLIIPFLIINGLILAFDISIQLAHGNFNPQGTLNSALASIIGLGKVIDNLHPVCTPLWFVIALFYIFMIATITFKSRITAIITTVVAASIAFIIIENDLEFYTPITSALMALPFFSIGYLIKDIIYFRYATLNKGLLYLIFVVTGAMLYYFSILNGRSDIATTNYGLNMMLFYINGIMGTIMVISLCLILPNKSSLHAVAQEYATGAIVVVGFNLLMISWGLKISKLLLKDNPELLSSSIYRILIGLTIFATLLFAIRFFKRYFPMIIGR